MMPRKGGKRPLKPGEKALWEAVTATVRRDPVTNAQVVNKTQISLSAPKAAKKQPGPRKNKPETKFSSSITPKLDSGDPGLAKRVSRGRKQIDATLDLHGMTQVQAHSRLIHFIDFAALRGHRVLLIITGKGSPFEQETSLFDEAPRGILRQRFLEWIEQSPLRHRISSVRQAHQKHGGRGAFYVFLSAG